MPFPSRGCRICRARRIKCDETRPVCYRCIKAGHNCGGYDQAPGGMPFRSENLRAEFLSRRSRRENANQVEGQDNGPWQRVRSSQASTPPTSSQQAFQQRMPTPSWAFGNELQVQALNHFMHYFFISPGGMPDGIWTHVQSFYSQSRTKNSGADTTLELAVCAASLAYFGVTQGVTQATTAARTKYGEALGTIKSKLDDDLLAGDDQILLAVMLLGKYESCTRDFARQSLFLEAYRHLDGATALVKLRKSQAIWDKRDSRLDRDIRAQLVRSAVYRARPIPEWLQQGADFGEEGSGLLLDQCLVRAANLRSRGADLWQREKVLSDAQAQEVKEIIDEASALDKALTTLATSLPDVFSHQTSQNITTDVQDNDFSYDETIYPSIWHATMCNRLRGARLLANAKIRKLICDASTAAALPPSFDQAFNLQQALSNERQIVDEICASVPYYLGTEPGSAHARNAFLLVWPLAIAGAIESIPSPRRLWIKNKLKYISLITTNMILYTVVR